MRWRQNVSGPVGGWGGGGGLQGSIKSSEAKYGDASLCLSVCQSPSLYLSISLYLPLSLFFLSFPPFLPFSLSGCRAQINLESFYLRIFFYFLFLSSFLFLYCLSLFLFYSFPLKETFITQPEMRCQQNQKGEI